MSCQLTGSLPPQPRHIWSVGSANGVLKPRLPTGLFQIFYAQLKYLKLHFYENSSNFFKENEIFLSYMPSPTHYTIMAPTAQAKHSPFIFLFFMTPSHACSPPE